MRQCTIENCITKHHGRGYCRQHYFRVAVMHYSDPNYVRRVRHGQETTTLYHRWVGMIQRCYDPKVIGYKNYGGRGIKVCGKWRNSFLAFKKDMGDIPEGMTLERIDNNGDYEPSNCKWATKMEQQNNKRTNHLAKYKGKLKTIAEISRLTSMPYHTIYDRICRQKKNL